MAINKEDLYFFIKKPRFAVVISALIVILGLLSLFGLQQEKYPNITPPQVTITASYPGASAAVIESSIASLLESQLNGVKDMIYMSSTSYDNAYNLTIFFKTGTDNDINLMNVQNKLQQVQSLLPQEVVQQGLTAENKVGGAGAIILNLASENESWNQLDLTNYANIYVKDAIKRINGVGSVNVFGADITLCVFGLILRNLQVIKLRLQKFKMPSELRIFSFQQVHWAINQQTQIRV